jgi:uncharacterized protein (DUF1810 family)
VTDRFDLDRFVTAQNRSGTYEQARRELLRGLKTSHWMWFVFPQIVGLGHSEIARIYAVRSLEEASAYLDHPVLGPRLTECGGIAAAIEVRSAEEIFGGVDALKLRSSMTLFLAAAPDEEVFRRVLDRFFDGLADPVTERILAATVEPTEPA